MTTVHIASDSDISDTPGPSNTSPETLSKMKNQVERTKKARDDRVNPSPKTDSPKGKGKGKTKKDIGGKSSNLKSIVSVREAREGNLSIRKALDLERTLISIFNSSVKPELQKEQVFSVCQSHFLHMKFSGNIPKIKETKDKTTADSKISNEKEKEKPKAKSEKLDKDTLYQVCPTKPGFLHHLSHTTPELKKVFNASKLKKLAKSHVDSFVQRYSDSSDSGEKTISSFLKICKLDHSILAKCQNVNFSLDPKTKVGIWPEGLNDKNRRASVAKSDPIAAVLYKHQDNIEASKVEPPRGNCLRTTYSLLWYQFQPEKVKSSKTLDGAVPTKELEIKEDDVEKKSALLFSETSKFWKKVSQKIDCTRALPQGEIDSILNEHQTFKEDKDAHAYLGTVDIGQARSFGRGCINVHLLLVPSKQSSSTFDCFADRFLKEKTEAQPSKSIGTVPPVKSEDNPSSTT